MERFWQFKAQADSASASLNLYGAIASESWFEDEITPKAFQKDLASMGDIKTLDVYINSPGGDAFAGIAIYNIMKRSKADITVHIDGLAASAASIIAMAGNKLVMPKNATLMIHNASAATYGNKEYMLKLAEELKRLDGQMADIYEAKTGIKAEEIAVLMTNETWFSGTEAFEKGFADEVEDNKKIAACADTEKFFNQYKNAPKQPEPDKITDNGADIPQPTTDINDSTKKDEELKQQQLRFDKLNRKILEAKINE